MCTVIFTCSRAGKSKPRKHEDPSKHRETTSKRIGCPCRVIARSPTSLSPCWRTASVDTTHNHGLNAGVDKFSNTQLTADERDAVASLSGRFGTKDAIFLLNRNWPDRTYDPRAVSNAIQSSKRETSSSDVSEAAELYRLIQERAREEEGWFVATELDFMGRLRRIFWMSPSQISLYRRYHDVVLNDNTFKTNRFNMALNVFVVVDTDGKNRLVACCLMSTEKIEDFSWILQQLLIASDGRYPHVIIVDEDRAMESACDEVIPYTTRLNCIWHLGNQNLNANLHGALGADWEEFVSAFWIARNSITQETFERRWGETVMVFAEGKPSAEAYLQRLYDRREHWAWPWVGTAFTVGMQSTQRVESVNANIKKLVHSKASLPTLFKAIEDILSSQATTARFLQYKTDMDADSPRSDSGWLQRVFSGVISENHYLGNAARHHMMKEMMRSLQYRCSPHVWEEDDRTDIEEEPLAILQEVSTK